MKHLAAIAVALTATTATADIKPDRVSILLYAHHQGASHSFEEFVPGVFLTWEGEVLDKTAGVYSNSFGDTSFSFDVSLPVADWDDGELSVFAGAAYYPAAEVIEGGWIYRYEEGLKPLVGLRARHENVFAQVMPMTEKLDSFVISGGVTW